MELGASNVVDQEELPVGSHVLGATGVSLIIVAAVVGLMLRSLTTPA